MADESPHRIWAYAPLAWLTLVGAPTAIAAIQWQRGRTTRTANLMIGGFVGIPAFS
jgi:hypothetical protein